MSAPFKMKGFPAQAGVSPFKDTVPTKEESKKKAIKKLHKTHDAQDEAEDKGDVLTASIAHAYGRKQLKEGRKLYGNK